MAPITLIVPAAEGGSGDRVGHIIAEHLEEILEAPVRLKYIAAQNGVAGTNAMAHAARDGKTLGLAFSSPLIGGKLLSRQATYNPIEDFDWLAILGSYGNAAVVRADSPARSMLDWLNLARGSAKPLRYGTLGVASAGQLAGEFLHTEQNVNVTFVVVESIAQAYAQLTSGELDLLFDGVPSAIVHARPGAYRMLAVTSAGRDPALPDVQAFGEIWPGQHFDVWAALVAPDGVAPAARARLAAAVSVMLLDKTLPPKLATVGFNFIGQGGPEARQFVRDEMVRQARMIGRLAIAPDDKADTH